MGKGFETPTFAELAYKPDGTPDLRNLNYYYCLATDGDLIIVCSDGVHDNLDPITLGKTAAELGLGDGLWQDVLVRSPAEASGPRRDRRRSAWSSPP